MSAELALAVVSVVDICIKLANKTLRICQAFRTAKKDLCDQVLLLETIWTKLEIQLVFLRGIKDHLTEELAQCHFDLLQRLHGTLLQAVSQLEAAASSIVASTSTGQGHVLTRMLQLDRWRYAVAKRGLDALMTELQCWQSLFDPSWYTIMLIGGKVLDPALQQLGQDRSRQLPHKQSPASPLDHMFALRKAIDYTINTDIRSANSIVMDETGWDFTTATSIPFSSVNVVARPKSQSLYVMEGLGTAPNTNTNTTSDAYQLCRRLQSVDPSIFGLLRCKGLLEIIDDNKTFPPGPQIVYHTPAQADPLKPPTTLRSLLLEQRPVCLSSVIVLAKQLVRSVSFVHTCDLVHKNIRPDNILLFPTALASLRPLELGQAFLVGFSQFRSINMETNRLGDTAWSVHREPKMVKPHTLVIGAFALFGSVKAVTVGSTKHDPKPGPACLSPKAVQSASLYTGLEEGTTGIRPGLSKSDTNPSNFINFCVGQTLTNGRQNSAGSCNGIPMGKIPASSNMITSIITHPQPGDIIPAQKTFNVTIQTRHLRAGFLVNPSVAYYTAPQDLDENGDIIGHCHITIQNIGSLRSVNPPDPTKFAYFKGVDDEGNGKGGLQAEVTGGLLEGVYRVCTIISARNHQPVVMPIAQRGSQDDCTKFVVQKAE
ncbi:hypothetical protein QC761_0112840 [Podospora bellae-mahoneyi]|uniref:Protein kinase domain-containing protein n=2 Tax=Podospora TaxID=5144 RepID=A0ABR0F9R9_9PEZI|nr:hypothetical protein QC761_0112840 [Podospora bellae-mahoneyi]